MIRNTSAYILSYCSKSNFQIHSILSTPISQSSFLQNSITKLATTTTTTTTETPITTTINHHFSTQSQSQQQEKNDTNIQNFYQNLPPEFATLRPTVAATRMRHRGASSAMILSNQDQDHSKTQQNVGYELNEAIRLVKAFAVANFDETIDLAVNLGLNPAKPNQMVRALAQLPHSFRKLRIAVFAKDDKANDAKLAGADIVGGAELAEDILKGNINFDRCIATPDMMAVVGRVARVLGPRGLMPNPKSGTVTNNIKDAIHLARSGQVSFKTDKVGIVHLPIAKASFTNEMIAQNVAAFAQALTAAKPSGAKGQFIRSVYMSSTMGKSVQINIRTHPFNQRV